jgi:excinuclease UvrABC nuclease subunit
VNLPPPQTVDLAGEAATDAAMEEAPAAPAVFLLWPREGTPYLSRTASLSRRLKRLLRHREGPSRLLNLRGVAERLEYWRTGSRLESALFLWALARRHFPDDYARRIRLRPPAYVKLILTHDFPRTQVTRRLSAGGSRFYGPFRSRAAAERFEGEMLDLFQIRRCPEDFDPAPEHPGCIYGEMNRCLRPCQQVVGIEEYAGEVKRVSEFLSSDGDSLLQPVAAARERFSDELNFEEAARQHQRHERIREVLQLRDELAHDINRLFGVAVTPSAEEQTIDLWFMAAGVWLGPRRFSLEVPGGRPVPLDRRLRELAAELSPPRVATRERQEHLAILGRWFYSSWRDGEWLGFNGFDAIPYRKLVNAIHRVAVGKGR